MKKANKHICQDNICHLVPICGRRRVQFFCLLYPPGAANSSTRDAVKLGTIWEIDIYFRWSHNKSY